MLLELDHLPEGLLDLEASQLSSVLKGPTLIHLPGRREPALFVTVLMHGNETTGWETVRALLRRYQSRDRLGGLPRSLSLFIANVSAAAVGLRRLDGQPDYNRVWPGCENGGSPEHHLMSQVMEIMCQRGVFASIDVHNTTGLNPHYACINRIDNRFLHLATMFSRTVVYFVRPCGVQSIAMSKVCPSVTLECGKPGQAYGVDHAAEYLDSCLHLSEHTDHPVAHQDIDLFHTVAIVKVPEALTFGFGDSDTTVQFAEDLDFFNFRELPRGTSLGRVKGGNGIGVSVCDEQGVDVTERFFTLDDGNLCLKVPVMPSMLSKDHRVVRQDCLCYLMERYDDHLTDCPGPDTDS
ncbi:MAG: peptidase M14 [Gammaproteobacteria bacterium]|nr:peptidase M14 [Gammaproteobacteria bacterium]